MNPTPPLPGSSRPLASAFVLLLAGGALAAFAASPRPVTPPSAAPTIKGFNAPITEGNRTVARVTGTEARPSLLAGEVQITGFRLETYRYPEGGNRETELVVESAFGAFGPTGASSDRALTLRSADERFAITGEGWGWNRTTALLVISNNVVTSLRRPGTDTNRPPVEVRSRRFEYNLRTGDARFLEDCTAVDPGQAKITAGLLASRLGTRTERPDSILATNGVTLELLRPGREGRAAGAHAVYTQSPEGERIELQGQPTWAFGPGEGSADHLLLLPARDSYTARGHARLRLHRTGSTPTPQEGTTGAARAGEPLEITAEAIEGGPREVVFTGPVHAVQGTRLELDADRVVASLAPNTNSPPSVGRPAPSPPRPTRVEATGNVSARVRTASTPVQLTGDRMVYLAGDPESIEVTGNPRWTGASHQGNAVRFVIHPAGPTFEAVDQVHVNWSSAGAAAGPIQLSAARMQVGPETARFEGGVLARRETWDIACNELEFALGTNAVPRSFSGRGEVQLHYLLPLPRPGTTNAFQASAGRLLDASTEEARRWTIQAAEVSADLSGTNAEPVRLEARGQVRIDHVEVSAAGTRLVYEAAEGLMHLTGGARLDTRTGLVIVGNPDTALTFDPRAPRFSVERAWHTLRLPSRVLRGGATNSMTRRP